MTTLSLVDVAGVIARLDGRIPDGVTVHQMFDGQRTVTLSTTSDQTARLLAAYLDLHPCRPSDARITRWRGATPINDKHAVLCVEHVDRMFGTEAA